MFGTLRTRNTIRFFFPESRLESRDYFVKEVVQKIMKMGPADILCLLGYEKDGVYDLTMRTSEGLARAVTVLETKWDTEEALRGVEYDICSSRYLVIVQAYNPYVQLEDIRLFLEKYCEFVSKGVQVIDGYGLWTGKWKFNVQFKMKSGSMSIPPRAFALGADKCHLYVPELPASATCWACGRLGHQSKDCGVLRCDQCYCVGHIAKNCPKPKMCSLCGSTSHLFRACPKRGQSYAGVVGQQKAAGGDSALQSKPKDERLASKESHVAASAPKAKPHGTQDGGSESGKRTKETEKKATPEGRQVGDWGDSSPSQEMEMAQVAAVASGAAKRPLVTEGEEGGPGRRLRTGPVVRSAGQEESGVSTDASGELEESDDSGEFEDSRGGSPTSQPLPESDAEEMGSEESAESAESVKEVEQSPPRSLPGWDEKNLIETTGMAPHPGGEPPPSID